MISMRIVPLEWGIYYTVEMIDSLERGDMLHKCLQEAHFREYFYFIKLSFQKSSIFEERFEPS